MSNTNMKVEVLYGTRNTIGHRIFKVSTDDIVYTAEVILVLTSLKDYYRILLFGPDGKRINTSKMTDWKKVRKEVLKEMVATKVGMSHSIARTT